MLTFKPSFPLILSLICLFDRAFDFLNLGFEHNKSGFEIELNAANTHRAEVEEPPVCDFKIKLSLFKKKSVYFLCSCAQKFKKVKKKK